MPARYEQQEIRKFDGVGKPRGQCVRLEMIDRGKRLSGCPGDAFCRHRADDQPADQPRPGCGGDAVEVVDAKLGLIQRLADQSLQMVEVRPRGDLRHDPAKGRVLGKLRLHQIGADNGRRAIRHHRDRGLIAAGLDTEHVHAPEMSRLTAPTPQAKESPFPAKIRDLEKTELGPQHWSGSVAGGTSRRRRRRS